MKEVKDKRRSSLVPLRLALLCVLFVSSFPTIGVWLDFGDFEGTLEDWNGILVASVILSVPLLSAAWAAIRNFRRIPVLAGFLIAVTIFHVGTTAWECISIGFNPSYDLVMDPTYLVRDGLGLAICATPFLAIYFCWRFFPWKRQLPESIEKT